MRLSIKVMYSCVLSMKLYADFLQTVCERVCRKLNRFNFFCVLDLKPQNRKNMRVSTQLHAVYRFTSFLQIGYFEEQDYFCSKFKNNPSLGRPIKYNIFNSSNEQNGSKCRTICKVYVALYLFTYNCNLQLHEHKQNFTLLI